METKVAVLSFESKIQAERIISLIFALCEERIKTSENSMAPELKALSASAMSVEKSLATFIAIDTLFE